uniref:Uncharacterized protein n=1 Tax=Parascaris univalens TaxID=6257 RepID=A0A915CKK1_PARUN
MDNTSVYGTEDAGGSMWPRGAMDNASVYGTEDCRFTHGTLCDPKIVKQRETVCGGVAQWTTRRSMEPKIAEHEKVWPRGAMDNASVYGTEDCRIPLNRKQYVTRNSFKEHEKMWPRGAMDNASVYGTEDCRFESCRGRVDIIQAQALL